MLKYVLTFISTCVLASSAWAAGNPHVLLKTDLGEIELELAADKAPISVKNFLAYVDSGFYNNTLFHRVIPGFMIQGGGYSEDLTLKKTQAPIRNEASNGLQNLRGTIAMARTQAVDSATSQFFINQVDNPALDTGSRGMGYAVFGKVVRGLEVVDFIAQAPTERKNMMLQNLPRDPIRILSASRLP